MRAGAVSMNKVRTRSDVEIIVTTSSPAQDASISESRTQFGFAHLPILDDQS